MLFQASYSIYKHCRYMKEGDEPPLRHSELNEVVIDHFKNNFSWKMERESLDAGRRSSILLLLLLLIS